MASFVAMEPESSQVGKATLVQDGFTYLAFLVPIPWLIWHRLWIEAAFALATALALAAAGAMAGFGTAASLLSLLVSLYVGLEAPALRIWALRRRGWRANGTFEADNRDEAEIRYLAAEGLLDPADQAEEPVAIHPLTKLQTSHSNSDLLLSPGTT